MLCRNRNIAAIFNTLRLHRRLVRALQIADRHQKCFIHKLVIFLRLAACRFSTEAYTSTSRCCSVRNWSKFGGVHKMRQKQPPLERLHFTCGQLQLLTSNNSPRNSGTLLMGCVTASGAPGSSCRHPEATQEVFSWTRTCEPAAQKPPKIANTFLFTRGSLIR